MEKENRTVLSFGYKEEMVDACDRLGIDIVSLVDPWDQPEYLPPCTKRESRVFTQDSTKTELILCALARKGKVSFDAVVSAFETTLVSASFLSLIVSKPFIDPMVAIAFRDKAFQKNILRGKLPVAELWFIEDVKYPKINENLPYPVILKPVAGAGTSHTYKINNKQELLEKLKKHTEDRSLPQSMVIEEFIHGEEWHVDGWMSQGELQLFAVSKYGQPLINIQQGALVQSVTLRPEQHKDLYNRLKEFLSTALMALGLKNGVFHLELFYNKEKDEFIFSECGARIGGGLIAQNFKNMFNVDLHEVLVKLALGEEVKWNKSIETSEYSGYIFLPSVSRDTKSLPEISVLKEKPGVVQVHYNWKPGQEMPDTRISTVQRTGMALVVGDSEEQVKERMHELIDYFLNLTEGLQVN